MKLGTLRQTSFKRTNYLTILILLLSVFLRLYRAEALFIFSADEEHQLSLAQTIAKDFHPIWIGVSAADTGFYMGPFWVYFSALWLKISNGDPAITSYVTGSLGVLTTFVVFYVGKKVLGEKAGQIGALLYACLPLVVYFDRRFWNPAPTSILSLGLLFSVYKAKDSRLWWIVVAFLYGMVFHVHLSLVPFLVVIVFAVIKHGKKPNIKITALSVGAFLFAISPLIIFDYFHKLSNLSTPFRVAQSVSNQPKRIDPVGHIVAMTNALGRMWYLPPNKSNADEMLHGCGLENPRLSVKSKSPILVSILAIFSLVWFLVRKETWKKESHRLIALWIIVLSTSFILLPNSPLEYYLLGLYPFVLLVYGFHCQNSKGLLKNLLISIAFLFGLLGIYTVLTAKDDYGLIVKKQLIKEVAEIMQNHKFVLKEEGRCHVYEGWRFLFGAYRIKPERASTDETLGWLYPEEITTNKTDFLVITSELGIPVKAANPAQKILRSGGYEIYIFSTPF